MRSLLSPSLQESQTIYFSQDQAELTTCHHLPPDILTHIFTFLSLKDIGSAFQVCKKWKKLDSDESFWQRLNLKWFFPKQIFDEEVWKKHIDLDAYGLSFDDLQPLNKRKTIQELNDLSRTVKIEDDAGITLLAIPKGLTFDKLIEIAKSPKQGNATECRVWAHIEKGLGKICTSKAYRVYLTNNVLEKSRGLSFSNQKTMVEKLSFEIPSALEMYALIILTYIHSTAKPPTRLYSDQPLIFARCKEEICSFIVSVGSFGIGGPYVLGNAFDRYYYGVGAKRNL